MTVLDTSTTTSPTTSPPARAAGPDVVRVSTWFGLAFTVCQLTVMVGMSVFVLPRAGRPGGDPLVWGRHVLDAADAYRVGNYVFMVAGVLLLGFLGAVHARLRRADSTGTLATVALAAGTLLSLVWPYAAVLHDVALETADQGTDPRLLAGWDAVAPYSLAFSALPRIFLVLAIVLALRMVGEARWLQRTGTAIAVVSLLGTATLVSGSVFPVLALSSLAYELWIGALAWHWLRRPLDLTAAA